MTESNGLQEVSVEMGRKGKWQLFYICNYGTEEFHSFYGVISRDDNGRALPNPYVSVLALKARASMRTIGGYMYLTVGGEGAQYPIFNRMWLCGYRSRGE